MTVLCDISLNKYDEDELIKEEISMLKRKSKLQRILDPEEKAVKQASKDLKIRQDNTYTDEEIDSYLPKLARKR